MLKTIIPATLEFRGGVPYSRAYGDIYHSADGGAGQARHVFLQGCDLPQAWCGRERYVILETGFGTGLNFLTTWAAWRDDPTRPDQLHFLSVEKHPFQMDDLARVHAQWPGLAALSSELRASWPTLMPGFHRIALDQGRVQLTLMLGDVNDCLPQVQARVDAFFLDGFSPDCNADMWQPALFDALAQLARTEATLATYTVEGKVRAELARVGFACEKRKGFGRKRHCLAARFANPVRDDTTATPRQVTLIGAGVAGASLAHALAQRGIAVTVLERAGQIGQGASGNPVAVFRPLVSRDDNRTSRLTRAAFLHDLRIWPALGDAVEWTRCGVLLLAKNEEAANKLQRALDETTPPETYARWLDLDAMRAAANWPVDAPGVMYSSAGWIVPGSLCRAWLDHPLIQIRTGCAVGRLRRTSIGWQVLDETARVLAESDAVVLTNASEAAYLAPEQNWPLHAVRGQVTRLPADCLPEIRRVVAREGYVAPAAAGPVVGATYEHDDQDMTPRRAGDELNLARLETILPGARARIQVESIAGRASLRATLPDRMPLLGAVSGQTGLYVAAGYGSRGVVWAGLLGEALADLLTGQPLPLERDLMRAISPARFER
ncbi:MAG: bifunctional tRNA (5-methylaminomethyl-2-thiouridine)(34)-methyltransferase MnmD/FAD-dependent 5-carboxymethylaminomethyl-2-thiouridine(34) oxidoreductase MnmC [Thiobacillus sp.]|nr:bifunctional tRNA (5-methylaminomethyl-2-thiouridine)(34)-methyltransferase MnmD/FAD-dependent 5-carboxymethylaminomethyl-2-thiouridine(34) oxidoreductase MnmC [Thiobacillus sp.]